MLLLLVMLALVQGITEFLPISSSGHLILVPYFLEVEDQGLLIDVAVHVGTLGAVMAYFHRDIWMMVRDTLGFGAASRRRNAKNLEEGGAGASHQLPGRRLAGLLLLASLPIIPVGWFIHNIGLVDQLRNLAVIGWTMLGFGIVLYIADQSGMTLRGLRHLGWGGALIIGLSQILALIPGTSRAGITITAARAMGFEREAAARFSMLLSIPTIIAAGGLGALEVWKSGDYQLGVDAAIAAGLSFISALLAISLFLRWIQRFTMTPFVVYRIGLGGLLLYLAYSG